MQCNLSRHWWQRVWPTHKPSVVYKPKNFLVLKPSGFAPLLKPIKLNSFEQLRRQTNVSQNNSVSIIRVQVGKIQNGMYSCTNTYKQSNPPIQRQCSDLWNMWRNGEGGGKLPSYTVNYTHTHRVTICCPNADHVHVNGHDRTIPVLSYTVNYTHTHNRSEYTAITPTTSMSTDTIESFCNFSQACTKLPDDGSSVIRNVLEHF